MNERIKELRIKLGLSQEEFGRELSIGKSAVSRIENGIAGLTNRNIVTICEKFNVRKEWLLTGSGDIFQTERETAIDELSRHYHLSNLEVKLLCNYLKLNQEQRRTLMSLIEKVVSPDIAFCKECDVSLKDPAPSMDPPKVNNTRLSEAAYEKSLGFVPGKELSASNTTEGTESIEQNEKKSRSSFEA